MTPELSFDDRLVKEAERKQITQVSRTQAWRLEREGKFPKRMKLSSNSIAWSYKELKDWVTSRQLERV